MGGSRKSRCTECLTTTVADCLDHHTAASDRLIVALSGGVDSVVLLHVLRSLDRPVEALHVHHGLSVHADRWADFCQDLCESWSIPLQTVRVDVDRDSADGLEGAARRARHGAYDRAEAEWILLGHHRSDRAETMMFNLLRGAGVRGAGAMPERSGRLLRPLLPVGRSDIDAYANAHELAWVEDHSNADTRFARNFLRHTVLPAIRGRFPAAEQCLASAAGRFAEAADLLDELARLDLAGLEESFPVPVAHLAALSEPRARNVLRFLLANRGVGIPSEERLSELLRQCLNARADRHPAISFGRHILRRRAGMIALEPVK